MVDQQVVLAHSFAINISTVALASQMCMNATSAATLSGCAMPMVETGIYIWFNMSYFTYELREP